MTRPTQSQVMSMLSIVGALALTGCGGDAPIGPPMIRYGDSVCTECGMIVSDERFATAMSINADRGRESLVFDDFNCQMIYEAKHPELTPLDRWSHDYLTRDWIDTADAWFVHSDQVHSPMASGIASFASQSDAEFFANPLGAQAEDFETVWRSE